MSVSSDIALSVRGLSKRYTLSHQATRHTTAAEALVQSARHLLRLPFQKNLLPQTEDFWALRDVSFDVAKGDVVGIIGRNGAGKSTLLKILSRITEPTVGQIDLYGRVGSLLEVGTGFHPELTGRENIFLNGAILGMSRREIARHFDAIVDFSGTEKFLDTPVKRYSSGMYVRLAFAVAAHLEPEILIVDEVLAVGDAEFQKKCVGKMQDVASHGRTVLFVSHTMSSVLQLCTRGVFLQNGQVALLGSAQEAVDAYVGAGAHGAAEAVWAEFDAPGDPDAVVLRAVRVRDERRQVTSDHYLSDTVTLEMEYECRRPFARLNPSFHVLTPHGVCVFATWNVEDAARGDWPHRPGCYRAQCVVPGHLLNEGAYYVSAFLVEDLRTTIATASEVATFHVLDDSRTRGDYTNQWIGIVRPLLPWQVERVADTHSSAPERVLS